MSQSVRVEALFEVLSRPQIPKWPVRVTLRFSDLVQRGSGVRARVGNQEIEGMMKIPGERQVIGYLRTLPRRGDELVLKDGAVERRTGVLFQGGPGSAAAALGDDLFAPPDDVAQARSFARDHESPAGEMTAGYALDTACTLAGATIRCGNCSATERRVRGAPGRLVRVPAAHVIGNAANSQLTEVASASFVRMREAAIADGTIRAGDDYLKLVSGYRDYATQTRLWKQRLATVFDSFRCSNWSALVPVVDATSAALAGDAPPHAPNAWSSRFRSELSRAGVAPADCDPARMRAAAGTEHVSVPASGAVDPVDLAVRIGRQTVAPPGASPHHTGRAVDVFLGHRPGSGPVSSASANVTWQRQQAWFQWLVCNASRFGFYPYNREPWHWEHNPPDA